jgi:hypothetical protein
LASALSGAIGQELAHDMRRHAKEMGAIPPGHIGQTKSINSSNVT